MTKNAKTADCKTATIAAVDRHRIDNGHLKLTQRFSAFAQKTASWTGHPATFLLAVGVIVIWIVTGPIFNYSDTWQLIINTGTTIVTFLMVFLIQNTQNRDMLSMQIKLSELVLAMKGAEDKVAAVEDLSDEELEELHADCRARAEMAADHLARRSKKAAKTSNKRATEDVEAA
ncbi:MAG: low affinity iron permease family protein [Proteobacteria bacterium]|nr:low affinity iron permease family protein [Pseudomonadota bacterium]